MDYTQLNKKNISDCYKKMAIYTICIVVAGYLSKMFNYIGKTETIIGKVMSLVIQFPLLIMCLIMAIMLFVRLAELKDLTGNYLFIYAVYCQAGGIIVTVFGALIVGFLAFLGILFIIVGLLAALAGTFVAIKGHIELSEDYNLDVCSKYKLLRLLLIISLALSVLMGILSALHIPSLLLAVIGGIYGIVLLVLRIIAYMQSSNQILDAEDCGAEYEEQDEEVGE